LSDEALEHAADALKVAGRLAVAPARISVQNWVARVYAGLGREAEALVLFQASRDQATAVGCPAELQFATAGLAALSEGHPPLPDQETAVDATAWPGPV
jgi:hypothetical protein